MKRTQPGRSPIGQLASLILSSIALSGGSVAHGQTADGPSTAVEKGTKRALIICGLPGDDEHRAMYAGATEKIARAMVDRCGFSDSNVWVRFGVEPKDGDGPALRGSRGLSTRENIAADADAIRKASTPDDALWVIVLGHGHFDGRRSHLNIPGPDLADSTFARLFEGIKAKEQVFFITTSASGFFLKPLAEPGRVAVSATEADQEVNETLYPLALADMLAATPPEADRDKDGTLSVFELYLAVVADVMRRYIEDELIPTEHAQLDDNGDGRGSEVQVTFLPPDSGDESDVEKDQENSKGKAKPKAEPKLGPKDDGYLSSKIRVDRAVTVKPQPGKLP
jgi:hypothetical protein